MPKQIWQAKDGELFDSEEDCIRHENATLFLVDMNDSEYEKNEKRWCVQKNFSRHFLNGFQRKESFWNYAESFRILADILDGKRPELPKEEVEQSINDES
tara:strand:+ start:654 stop:953 length:300 start_codon:yes stop_codon:yes gene_type:complete